MLNSEQNNNIKHWLCLTLQVNIFVSLIKPGLQLLKNVYSIHLPSPPKLNRMTSLLTQIPGKFQYNFKFCYL